MIELTQMKCSEQHPILNFSNLLLLDFSYTCLFLKNTWSCLPRHLRGLSHILFFLPGNTIPPPPIPHIHLMIYCKNSPSSPPLPITIYTYSLLCGIRTSYQESRFPFPLSWLVLYLLWPVEFSRSDTIPVLSLSLKRTCMCPLSLSQTPAQK